MAARGAVIRAKTMCVFSDEEENMASCNAATGD